MFLQNNYESFGNIAKCAIAQTLLDYESEEALHSMPNNNWYMHLYKLMRTNPPTDFNRNSVSFITFNYDLSLDQFLYNSILNSSTSLNNIMALRIIQSIPRSNEEG